MYTFDERQIFFSASQSVSLTVPVKVLRLLFAVHVWMGGIAASFHVGSCSVWSGMSISAENFRSNLSPTP